MSEIRQCVQVAPHNSSLVARSDEPNIKDLARHLTTSKTNSSAVSAPEIVDTFLSCTRLPTLDCAIGRTRQPIDNCHLAALVTFDLAVCSGATPTVSRDLMQIARGKLSSASSGCCPPICSSLASLMDSLIALLCHNIEGDGVSLAAVLANSIWPLTAKEYVRTVEGLACIEKVLCQTHDSFVRHSLHGPTVNQCECLYTPDDMLSELVHIMQSAMPTGGLLALLGGRFVTAMV